MTNKIINDFLIKFINISKNPLFLYNEIASWRENKNISLFSLKEKWTFFYNYFQNDDNNIYDLIIADLPYGYRSNFFEKVENVLSNYRTNINWIMIYKLLNNLSDNWILIVWIEPNFWIDIKSKNYLNILKEKWYYLKWLIETPKKILTPYTNIQPFIAIFDKTNNNDKIYIASLNEIDDISNLINNFNNKISNNNLSEWIIIKLESFKWFYNYRINKKIDSLQTQYNEFEKKHVSIDNIFLNIKSTKDFFTEEEWKEYIYIPLFWTLEIYNNIINLDKKQHNYFQIEINTKIITTNFLVNYFKSDIWQLSLKSLFSGISIKKINKNDLKELILPIPPIKTQININSWYKLLKQLSNIIINIENDLSLNPKNANIINTKLTDTLTWLEAISKEDKIFEYIRNWESLTLEFKSTFSKNLKTNTNDKNIEHSALKSIVWFFNKKWWILLIWVEDNCNIYWIENDSYKSNDKYLLNFKNKIDKAIWKENLDLINYEIIEVDNHKILLVECSKSNKPVYLYWKDFYVRTNPATDKLEWPQLVEYIKKHF